MTDGALNLLDGALTMGLETCQMELEFVGRLLSWEVGLNLFCADLEINVPRMMAKSRRRRKKYSKIRSQGWGFEYVGRRLMLSDGDK